MTCDTRLTNASEVCRTYVVKKSVIATDQTFMRLSVSLFYSKSHSRNKENQVNSSIFC